MSNYEFSELIAHEDGNFLIVNKPAGALSQDDQGNDVSMHAMAQTSDIRAFFTQGW